MTSLHVAGCLVFLYLGAFCATTSAMGSSRYLRAAPGDIIKNRRMLDCPTDADKEIAAFGETIGLVADIAGEIPFVGTAFSVLSFIWPSAESDTPECQYEAIRGYVEKYVQSYVASYVNTAIQQERARTIKIALAGVSQSIRRYVAIPLHPANNRSYSPEKGTSFTAIETVLDNNQFLVFDAGAPKESVLTDWVPFGSMLMAIKQEKLTSYELIFNSEDPNRNDTVQELTRTVSRLTKAISNAKTQLLSGLSNVEFDTGKAGVARDLPSRASGECNYWYHSQDVASEFWAILVTDHGDPNPSDFSNQLYLTYQTDCKYQYCLYSDQCPGNCGGDAGKLCDDRTEPYGNYDETLQVANAMKTLINATRYGVASLRWNIAFNIQQSWKVMDVSKNLSLATHFLTATFPGTLVRGPDDGPGDGYQAFDIRGPSPGQLACTNGTREPGWEISRIKIWGTAAEGNEFEASVIRRFEIFYIRDGVERSQVTGSNTGDSVTELVLAPGQYITKVEGLAKAPMRYRKHHEHYGDRDMEVYNHLERIVFTTNTGNTTEMGRRTFHPRFRGYTYDFANTATKVQLCGISGSWHERLNAISEINFLFSFTKRVAVDNSLKPVAGR